MEVDEKEPETKQYHIATSTTQGDVIYIWEEVSFPESLGTQTGTNATVHQPRCSRLCVMRDANTSRR